MEKENALTYEDFSKKQIVRLAYEGHHMNPYAQILFFLTESYKKWYSI